MLFTSRKVTAKMLCAARDCGKCVVYRYRIAACDCLYEMADAPNCLLL